MSHITTLQVQMRDEQAIRAACQETGAEFLGRGVHTLFGSQTVEGVGFKLSQWRYPLVATEDALKYDTFCSKAGAGGQLNQFRQSYAKQVVLAQARRKGQHVTEQRQADGSIRLVVHAR
ncbi:MAG: DUF1257 domain-containing protein [Pirellulaceae bacterium]